MKRAVRNGLVVLGAALLSACEGSDQQNPFSLGLRTVTPPPSAELLFTSDAWSTATPTGREVFAVAADGSGLTRLTYCNEGQLCDYADVAPASDRVRLMTRRFRDQNGDRRLSAADGAELAFVDLARGVEGTTVPSSSHLTGVDWSPLAQVVVYTARGATTRSDLFRQDPNGQNSQALSATPEVDEQRPRLDAQARVAAYERTSASGRTQAVMFFSQVQQFTLTPDTIETGPALPDGSYRVGSDADPSFSPDAREVVLRRLRAVGTDGRGEWDIVIVSATTSTVAERVLVSGPAFRGAPDWSSRGIAFPESDPGSNLTRLVIVQPDGTGRRTPVTVPARISSVRWLTPAS